MKCERCNKKLIPIIGREKLNPKRRFCDSVCRNRHNAIKHYSINKDIPEYKIKKSKEAMEWYEKNKKRQYKNVNNDYKKNRHHWVERTWTNKNRKKILFYLSDNCHLCGKHQINIIHHETYNTEKRKIGKKQTEEYIEEYCKHILGFCSTKCHLRYHRNINRKKNKLNI